jgi:carboxylate-amine ligase
VAPRGGDDPVVVVLSDGPSNSAFYEHRTLAAGLGLPLVRLEDLHPVPDGIAVGRDERVDVVYRRTDEDRVTDERGRPTPVARTLLAACHRGELTCANGFGSGIADDKLVHAYVEDMIRFYLGEEPRLRSVPTHDLGSPRVRDRALARLGELVVKPRAGSGGDGVFVGPRASAAEREAVARAVAARPYAFIAQETVCLSRHPTVIDGRLEPRHVDLRMFAFAAGEDVRVMPGGLTRVALEAGSLVVNSSREGGGKDTWVLG